LSLRADLGSPLWPLARPLDADVLGAGLSGLDTVLDMATMGRALATIMAPRGAAPMDVTVLSADLVDFKFDKRALIAYELETQDRAELILGKHFADLAHARRVYEVLAALHAITDNASTRWGVPRPLGWLPQHGLVLYVPVEGRFLDEDLDGNAPRWMGMAAECLAELHSTEMALDRSLDLVQEAVSIAAWAGVVASTFPDLADEARRLGGELAGLGGELEFESGAPIHKDVHYRHMVVADKLILLDFDEMRLGDSSFDVAHFCAHLHLLAFRRGTSAEDLERPFLSAYVRHRPWVLDERFDFFFAYTCLKLTWLLCLGEGVAPRPAGAERHRQASALLELGAARLEPHASRSSRRRGK
jgi:hypothetical protein